MKIRLFSEKSQGLFTFNATPFNSMYFLLLQSMKSMVEECTYWKPSYSLQFSVLQIEKCKILLYLVYPPIVKLNSLLSRPTCKK